jgi:flagellar biosynthesis protein FlhF
MQLKRYQAQTVKAALRAAREELGPEALVLSTRLVAAPGPKGWFGHRLVEITAAASRPFMPDGRPADGRVATGSGQAAAEMAARLAATGLSPRVAREVAGAHPPAQRRGASLRHVRATLAGQLATLVAPDETYAAVEAFVGPPGAGKTTTIAKIAAQALVRHGHRLGLVVSDAFRPGAVEQLRLYAGVLGSPLSIARTPYELLGVIEGATGPLLVDTAGRSPSDEDSRDMLRVLASRPDVRTHLVVAADTPPGALDRLIDRFSCARPSRIVLTRLDDSDSLPDMLSWLRDRGLVLSYLGTGQRVPGDLEIATPGTLASWVTGESGCAASTTKELTACAS